MTMRIGIDKERLLSHLAHLEPEKNAGKMKELMRRISMSTALPALTEINHENEYKLCRELAAHVVGKVHEPETGEL
jgi:hypothetical protein